MMSWRRPWPWLLLVSLVVWWGALWVHLDRSILTRVPILDEAFYLQEGAAIAGGRLLPGQPFIMSPLYPYLVAVTGSGRELAENGLRDGSPPWGIRLLQAACWCGIAFLLFLAGRRMLPGRWGLLAPLLFIFYRPAAIFVTTTLLEIPLACAATAFLYLISRWASPVRPGATRALVTAGAAGGISSADDASTASSAAGIGTRGAIGAGVLLGLAVLLRGHLILLLGAGLLAMWPDKDRWRRFAVLTATTLALLLPLVLYNSLTARRPVGLTCNAGLNLYIGNGPEADGFYVSFAGFNFETDPAGVGFLSARLERPLDGVAEADRIWARAAWDAMREHPVRVVILWWKKIWLHTIDWEISQVTPLPAWRRDAPALGFLFLPYGVLVAAGLTGLILTGWRDRRLRLWSVALLLLIGSQSLFFVVSRYRFVAVPLLCLLGAAGARVVLTSRGRRLLVACLVVVGAVLITRPWGLADVRAHWDALGACNEAVRWEGLEQKGALDRAAELYRSALKTDPTQMVAYRNLARVLVRQELPREAERFLAQGILRVPRPEFIEKDLISLLLEQGRVEAALPRLATYLRDHPPDADVLHNYTVALAQTGRHGAALEAARQLVQKAPVDPRGYIDLGILLVQAGRPDEARAVFSTGLECNPGHADLQHNLARLQEREP